MDTERLDDDVGPDDIGDVGPDGPAHSTGWVARRLGVAPATLRTWHRRYRIGPTGRTTGGHRRYLPQDLDRLERMQRLVLAGMPTSEAARVSEDPSSAPPSAANPPATDRSGAGARTAERDRSGVRRMVRAAMTLDQPAVAELLADALRRQGVASTWMHLVVPILTGLGERHARGTGRIDVEHLFTECVRTALCEVITNRTAWDGYPPVLLACPDQEQHSLPLYALAATLAELGCPSRLLGASVPAPALASAARATTPRAVFLWAQTPVTARPADLDTVPQRRPPTLVVVGGPGWRGQTLPSSVTPVDSLLAAVQATTHDVTAAVR